MWHKAFKSLEGAASELWFISPLEMPPALYFAFLHYTRTAQHEPLDLRQRGV